MTIEVNLNYLRDALRSDKVNDLWFRLSEQEWEYVAQAATASITGVEYELEAEYDKGREDGYDNGFSDGYIDGYEEGLAVAKDV